MKRFMVVLAIACVSALLVVGCRQAETPTEQEVRPVREGQVTIEDVGDEMEEAAQTGAQYALQTKEEYMETIKEKMAELDEQIAKLTAKAATLADDAKTRVQARLQDLTEKREAFLARMKDVGSASGDAWEEMKEGLEAAWKDLEEAYQEAASEFEKETTDVPA
jgi:archaellum component FlaC